MNWYWLISTIASIFKTILCTRCGAKCSPVRGLPGRYRCRSCGEDFYRE